MDFASPLRLAAFALIVSAGVALGAPAADAGAPSGDAQQPAAAPATAAPSDAPQNPLPGSTAQPSTAPDVSAPNATAPNAATDPQSCLAETGDYVTHGNAVSYVIGIANNCDRRLKCTIDAYVVGAKGPASGHTTMILGASSSGAAAKKSYTMRVKSAGGTAQVSRDCKVF